MAQRAPMPPTQEFQLMNQVGFRFERSTICSTCSRWSSRGAPLVSRSIRFEASAIDTASCSGHLRGSGILG